MAVGLSVPESFFPVQGVRLASLAAGIKTSGATDLVLMELSERTEVAAVFTRNAFCAAPVTVAREHLNLGSIRALLINSGNANAGTGRKGMENCWQSCTKVATQLGIEAVQVMPFSTGVISQQLPMDKLLNGIEETTQRLSSDHWLEAARGIMTTDTLPKLVSRQVELGDTRVTITGICKGAGMIRPDMATMLAFVATDARLPNPLLQECLNEAVQKSFNSISIDGDTSTNDACVLVATGKAQNEAIAGDSDAAGIFQKALNDVCTELAQAIVRDGEGASKFITLDISGGKSTEECREVAYTIAHSPLVKTAFFASDPNIGRLLAAVGRSPVKQLDLRSVDIVLDDVEIVVSGEPAKSYTEERGQQVMNREEITVSVKLGRGSARAVVWTTDLSHEYVRINAEYRT